MVTEKTFISEADGLEISYLVVTVGTASETGAASAGANPKCIFQILHGMAEHKERYIPMMEYLASNGIVCAVHDHRGHGKSLICKEDRGYFYRGGWRGCVDDAHQMSGILRDMFPGVPLVLYGHSMGSLVARCYIKRYPEGVSKLILSGSPSANPAAGAGLFIALAQKCLLGEHHRSKLLHGMSFGAYNDALKRGMGKGAEGRGGKAAKQKLSPNAWLSHDSSVVDAYDQSDDCGYVFTAQGFESLLKMMMDCYSRKGWKVVNPGMPVMFVSGAEDPCRGDDRKFASAVESMRRVGYTNVTATLVPGMRHEVHNEVGKEKVWKMLEDFCD